jgi:hypothetical protein
LIKELKCVKNARKSITRTKTSIGVAGHMLMTTEEKFGGAVENEAKSS